MQDDLHHVINEKCWLKKVQIWVDNSLSPLASESWSMKDKSDTAAQTMVQNICILHKKVGSAFPKCSQTNSQLPSIFVMKD